MAGWIAVFLGKSARGKEGRKEGEGKQAAGEAPKWGDVYIYVFILLLQGDEWGEHSECE